MTASPPPAAGITPVADVARLWRDLSQWFVLHSVELLIGTVVGVLIVAALLALRGLGARLADDRDDWRKIAGRVIARTGTIFIVALAAQLVSGYANAPPGVARTIEFVFTIAAVFQGAVWLREFVLGFVEHRTAAGSHEGLASALGIIRLLVTIVLFAVATLVVLDNLGVNITGLVAGLGIGGIAIGLAAQGIFADLFAALSILFDRPFRRGDSISYDDTAATVEAIGLKTTRLRSFTGEQRIISNQNLLDKEIRNNTRLERRRVKWVIGVTYQTSQELCVELPTLLREVIEAGDQTFVRAGFTGFGASSLDFLVEFDVMDSAFDAMFDARHTVGIAILKRLNEAGIEIAYPTQTSFTAAPDGRLVMPYPEVQAVQQVGRQG